MDEFEENQRRLLSNSYRVNAGAPREGANLLQGVIFCGKCGRKMYSTYPKGKFAYVCNRESFLKALERCTYAGANRVDQKMEQLVLDVLGEGTVDLTFAMLRTERDEIESQKREWIQKIKRLEYEEKIAQKRYNSVDPENRLVAGTLEKDWNARLIELEQARKEMQAKFGTPVSAEVTAAEMKELLRDLPTKWRNSELSINDKKEIIRCVIERVVVTRNKDSLALNVHWHGGSMTAVEVPKRLISSPALFDRIEKLTQEHTDEETANILNAEKITTYRGRRWNTERVSSFRAINGIPSLFHRDAAHRIASSPYLSTIEVGEILGVGKCSVEMWIKLGFFEVKVANCKRFWIKADDEIFRDLSPKNLESKGDVPVSALIGKQGHSLPDVIQWARAKGHRVVRVQTKNPERHRFVVRFAENEADYAQTSGGT